MEILHKAVSSVLTDGGFDLASERAQGALSCAERLLKWVTENKEPSATNVMNSLVVHIPGQ